MIDSLKSTDDIKNLRDSLKSEIGNNVVGLDRIIDSLVISILVGGHVLIEGFPGTGKTLIANLFSKSIESTSNRIQSTSDLMPSDITGTRIYNPKEREFEFRSGPVFSNFVLVDEINRAPPKTQSALLECMQERQVSVEGMTRKLDEPFMVLATKNSSELESGTYPLPEAQLDRFMFNLNNKYPSTKEEVAIVRATTTPEEHVLNPIITKSEIASYQDLVRRVPASDNVVEYAVRFVDKLLELRKFSKVFINSNITSSASQINRGRLGLIFIFLISVSTWSYSSLNNAKYYLILSLLISLSLQQNLGSEH